MSEKQPISIDAKDPEYYTELLTLRNTFRPANWCLPSDERPYPDILDIQDVDSPPSRRPQTLLDALADISLCQRGNVSATMASLKVDGGTLVTRLYIVFDREDGEAAHRCPQHLENIFHMLRQVPYRPAMNGSRKGHRGLVRERLHRNLQSSPQLFIRHFCASRYQAQAQAFGHSEVHRAGSDVLLAPGSLYVGEIPS